MIDSMSAGLTLHNLKYYAKSLVLL